MVKLTSFMALSTLIIAPTFASVLPSRDIETRDVAGLHLFGRDMEGLFAREQDFELPDLARRLSFWGGAGLTPRDDAHDNLVTRSFTQEQLALHPPPCKHDLDELNIRDVIDDDLFERFHDDLD